MKIILFPLAALVCFATASAVSAAENGPATTVNAPRTSDDMFVLRVAHDDLNLARAEDANTLRTRVSQTVWRACDSYFSAIPMTERSGCRRDAMRVAAPQVAAAIENASALAGPVDRPILLRFARR